MRQLTLIDNDIKDLNFDVEENETLKLDFAMFSDFKPAKSMLMLKKAGLSKELLLIFQKAQENLK